MPRRKQGHSREIAPGGHLKKTIPGTELVQNESFKSSPTKNDLLITLKKNATSNFSSSTSNEKIVREHLEASKSLNDSMVSQQEINNNFVELPAEPNNNNNEKCADAQKSDIVFKDGKSYNCLNHVPWNFLSTTSLLNSDSSNSLPIVTSQNENRLILVIPEHSNVQVKNTLKNISPTKVNSDVLISSTNAYALQSKYQTCSQRTSDMEIEKSNTEMSGVSPPTTINYRVGNQAEAQQMNYRVTSFIDNSIAESKETIGTSEGQNYQLPSSVYGTPASTVEKMLTNHQSPEKITKDGKTSFLQEILEQKSIKSKDHDSDLHGENKSDNKFYPQNEKSLYTTKSPILSVSDVGQFHSKLEIDIHNTGQFTHTLKSPLSVNDKEYLNPKFKLNTSEGLSVDRLIYASKSPPLPVINKEQLNHKLKLNIPEGLTTDDSNSSVFSTESTKSSKCPRITSPQILEQRINKIISNNIAIVDTVDVVWPRRYSKLTNSSSAFVTEGDSRKLTQKSISLIEEKNVPQTSLDNGIKSKLQSALLGGSEGTIGSFQKNSVLPKASIPKDRIASQFNTFLNAPTASTYSKLTNSVTEEELKGNAVKSLLSLRQGQFSKEKSAFTFDKDNFAQHPQNPEGSIIKDLLLKSKSQEDLRLYNDDSFYEATYRMKNRFNNTYHKCSRCHAEFPDKHTFEIHSSKCFKNGQNNLLTLRDPVEPFKLQEINAQSKALPLDHQYERRMHTLHEKSKSEVVIESDDGPILKKQLLMPLSSSPPTKRRKVSDSVILSSNLSNQNGSNDFKSSNRVLNNMDLLPYRSRSQSMHLFGGEVQVLDGYRTKKIKIQNLPGAFPTCTGKVADFEKSNLKGIDKDVDNLSAAVVTIAQPVHNSGGTLHLPTKIPTSSFSPMKLSLPGHMVDEAFKYKISEGIGLNSNISKNPSLPLNRDVFLPMHNKYFYMESQTSELDGSLTGKDVLPGPMLDDLSFTATKVTPSSTNKLFYSPIFSTAEDKFESFATKRKEVENNNNHTVPTVLFTPSSPTYPAAENEISPSDGISQPNKKFLAPTRPTSLPFKKKPITMVSFGTGTTLISPETPRPKKSCVQLYLNGHAYTYLGLKCSTRSTYCCIYRPQPMFVLQETNPKLSMYSNWQVVPAKEELCGLTPGQMMSLYCSKQEKDSKTITTTSKLGEPLIFTHSSYWTYRSQDKAEQNEVNKTVSDDLNTTKCSSEVGQELIPTDNSRSESVITSVLSKPEKQLFSTDESSVPLDTENTLSDGDINNSNDEDDDDDCQDDGTESLTDSSQAQPPKRVKIFEGGFKSNEDYTYVRGRGRGKYVCEECGIRCKKPSMLKKHIRTHTDLRPYKCKHCSFAFKTKGNLTKHMKSKAHHKKCTELGIIPVPTTTDDSQIDAEALAKQIEKRKAQFSDGEDADDDDDEDSDESDDECESDTSSMIIANQKSKMLTNGHSKKPESQEKIVDSYDDNTRSLESLSKQAEEHEAARSLLHLSVFGEPSQWSTSTGDLTDVTSTGESEVGSSTTMSHDQSLLSPSSFASRTMSSTVISSTRSKNISDQWLSTETLGHRPRSYSADIPLSGGKQVKYKLVKDIIAETGTKLQVDDSLDFGSKEQYARRYSISVAREARKPCSLNPHEWPSLNTSALSPRKWRDVESADQPMDLSITRDLSKCKPGYSSEIASSFINVISPEEGIPDMNLATSIDSCLNESYQLKSLPVLSPQVLVEYETGENNTDPSLLPLMDDQTSLGASTSRSVYYVQDVPSFDNVSQRNDAEISEDPSSPDMVEYVAVCSPVSPPNLEDSSYYYSQEGVQAAANSEELQSSSRHQAEFIVPSTSSGNMEEGKCVCRICNKMFAKSSHLRLHVNIHYFERPFRCDNCAVSFRTKGHLQKHKRSVSHYNKVNMNLTFGTPTVDNPRPFKCADCKIAFRIHGHLAKHLRSKMHIMKLECLGKLPFGMYAEMERSGVSLNEIDTTDCNNSLESLQVMAQKLYQRDPRRMRWQGTEQTTDSSCVMPTLSATNAQTLIDSMLPLGETLTTSFEPAGIVVNIPVSTPTNSKQPDNEEVKQEVSQTNLLRMVSTSVDTNCAISSLPQYVSPQSTTSQSQNTTSRVEVSDLESAMSLNRSGTCHICGRHFKSAKFLQVHLYCDHPPMTPSSVNETSVDASSSESRELTCDLCGKTFPDQKILQQHLLSHAQPRPFVCEICDAGFTSSSSLVAHQATHQNNSSASASDNRIVQLK